MVNKGKIFRHGAEFFWAGFVFNVIETWHFGWNLKPQSPSEMLCDYIALGMMVAGIFAVVYAVYITEPTVVIICNKCNESGETKRCSE